MFYNSYSSQHRKQAEPTFLLTSISIGTGIALLLLLVIGDGKLLAVLFNTVCCISDLMLFLGESLQENIHEYAIQLCYAILLTHQKFTTS